jgi:signal transduction histidine kinase
MSLCSGCASLVLAGFLAGGVAAQTQAPAGTTQTETVPLVSDSNGGVELAQAAFAHTGELQPPAPDAAWQTVALPDSWRKMSRDNTRLGWYRLHFDLARVPASPQAVYITRVTNNVALHVDGVLLGVSGDIDKREMSWNIAQLFVVPPQLLKAGRNEILVRLHPDEMGRAGLARVHVGSEAQMRALYERRILLQSTAPKFIAVLLGLTALLSVALWASRRQETVFGFFALLCMATKARLWHTYARDIDSWGWVVAVPSLSWMMATQTYFVLRFCGQSSPRFERFTAIYALVSTVILLFSFSGTVLITFILVNSLVALVMLAILARALTRAPNLQNLTLLAAIVVNFLLAMHDLINYEERFEFDTLYLLPLGGPLLLFAVAILLIRRFVGVLQQHEALNAELATRVRERESELAHSYERLRVVDKQRTTSDERQRLMRDMHDGIGSHLMSTLALARVSALSQHQLVETLTDCIDELKLTIDSLEPVESDLLTVLGNLRYRLEPRLHAAGIALEWAVSDLPPLPYLDPENVRSVLRIVQEAFTNTLKHAQAKCITLSTGVDAANARVYVRVTDDGKGLDHSKTPGRGLENMKSRAAKLHGQVEFQSPKTGGTCVNLYLPLAKMA